MKPEPPSFFNHAEAIKRCAERLVWLVAQNHYPRSDRADQSVNAIDIAIEMELRVIQRRLMRFPRFDDAQQAASDIENDEAAAGLAMRFPKTRTGPG